MPVLRSIRERFERERPLDGLRVAACLHVTSETANLLRTLIAGGAQAQLCASNPLSTQDDVAAALVERHGVDVYAVRGEDADAYASHVVGLAARAPHVTLDDGADLLSVLHAGEESWRAALLGGTEETTTRARAPARARARRAAALPGARSQRVARRAHVQRSLRHGAVDARRHPARDEHAARRSHGRRARLRLDRQGRRAAREGRRRVGGRLRGRPDARARGTDGRLRGHARARGRRARRRLHHGHRQS